MFKSVEAILGQLLEYLSESYLMVQYLSHCDQIKDNLTKVVMFGGMQPLLLHSLQIKFKKA